MQTDFSSKDPVSRLIFELSKLPGIGEKTATRLAYYILKQDSSFSQNLAEALTQAKIKTRLCETCFTFASESPCSLCANTHRDKSTICVVEKPSDVYPIENSGSHKGSYHVLHGAISPLDGIGPDDLKIKELLARVQSGVTEVILATNSNVEGEATALYLAKLIRPFGVKITQIAQGLPVGGQLEYTDRQTIGRAMNNRMELR